MSKALRKAIMHRSEFKNIYNKKWQMQIGQIIKFNGIFVFRYFGELRKRLFSKSKCKRFMRQKKNMENN